jgi:hypothetical protein
MCVGIFLFDACRLYCVVILCFWHEIPHIDYEVHLLLHDASSEIYRPATKADEACEASHTHEGVSTMFGLLIGLTEHR